MSWTQMSAGPSVGGRKAHTGPRGVPAVHPCDPVVSSTEVSAHRLKAHEREDPVVGIRIRPDRRLEVMVLRRDEHVKVVGRRYQPPVVREASGRRALQERRPGRVLDNESPRLVGGEACRQPTEDPSPLLRTSRRLTSVGPHESQNGQLREEGVPRVALMRPQGGEGCRTIGDHRFVHAGQGESRDGAIG